MINEFKAHVLQLDTCKEIFDLWYELIYLKLIIQEMMNQNTEISELGTKETFDKCRDQAKEYLRNKFKIDLAFSNPEEVKRMESENP